MANDYLPPGCSDRMVDERFAQPIGPFNVLWRPQVRETYEPWNVRELETFQEAKEEAQILEDHLFEDWEIVSVATGESYKPQLKKRGR